MGKTSFNSLEEAHINGLQLMLRQDLGETNADVLDRAIEICPVGAILKKRQGYSIPVGQRKFDHKPIGSEIEDPGTENIK